MSLNLPAPIDQAKLNERVEAWANGLVASYDARHPDQPVLHVKGAEVPVPAPYVITVERLTKYWRIVMANYGQRSVHAFLDPTTGDVLKAAGWKSPAKGVRYNLLDDESFAAMLAALDPFGSYLYIR